MMQSNKKSSASSRTVSLVLPASVGSSKRAGTKKTKRKEAQTSSVPVALGPHPLVGKPNFSMAPGSDGRVRVRHREFVMDVMGSQNYACHALSINPASPSAFPWLATLAQSYETYVFTTLRFEYMPAVGTSVNGVVLLAVDFDAADPSPVDKSTFMQTHGAVRGSPWDYTVLNCSKADLTKLPQHFTRKTQWNGSGDIKTYDVGNLLVATHGQSATTAIGELYVTYDVELRTPQPVLVAPEVYSATIVGGGTMTPAKPLGDVPVGVKVNPTAAYNPVSGVVDFLRTGKQLLTLAYQVGSLAANTVQTTLNQSPAANGTVAYDGRGYLAEGVLTEEFLVDVAKLPFSLTPVVSGTANTVASSRLRLAPYST